MKICNSCKSTSAPNLEPIVASLEQMALWWNWKPIVPSFENTDSKVWAPLPPGTRNPMVGSKVWEPSVPHPGVPRLAGIGSKVWEPAVLKLKLGPRVPRLGSIGSKVWEPAVPQSIGSKVSEPAVLKLGTRGSKIGKYCFEGLGTIRSSNWDPVVSRLGGIGSKVWEPAVPQTGNRGSKICKHWFQGLGTSSSSKWERVVPKIRNH